jgi:hypothetical protein
LHLTWIMRSSGIKYSKCTSSTATWVCSRLTRSSVAGNRIDAVQVAQTNAGAAIRLVHSLGTCSYQCDSHPQHDSRLNDPLQSFKYWATLHEKQRESNGLCKVTKRKQLLVGGDLKLTKYSRRAIPRSTQGAYCNK